MRGSLSQRSEEAVTQSFSSLISLCRARGLGSRSSQAAPGGISRSWRAAPEGISRSWRAAPEGGRRARPELMADGMRYQRCNWNSHADARRTQPAPMRGAGSFSGGTKSCQPPGSLPVKTPPPAAFCRPNTGLNTRRNTPRCRGTPFVRGRRAEAGTFSQQGACSARQGARSEQRGTLAWKPSRWGWSAGGSEPWRRAGEKRWLLIAMFGHMLGN